jgi:prevent-host-death family protein
MTSVRRRGQRGVLALDSDMTILKTIMVMKVVRSPYPIRGRVRRLSVAETKAKLSEALRGLAEGPTIIHSRGREVGVLISMEEYEQSVVAPGARQPKSMRQFLEDIEALKKKMGGGVDFHPPRARIHIKNPFGRA